MSTLTASLHDLEQQPKIGLAPPYLAVINLPVAVKKGVVKALALRILDYSIKYSI